MIDMSYLRSLIARLGWGSVAMVGSRTLPPGGLYLVRRVADAVRLSGRSIITGCCIGVDAAVIQAASRSGQLSILAAFGPYGEGSCSTSARDAVEAAARAGVPVVWWSGGYRTVPLAGRLSKRTLAVAAMGTGGLVAVLGSPESAGSLLAMGQAAKMGRPMIALCADFPASALPPLGGGTWSAIGDLTPGFQAAAWGPALL